MAKKTKRVKKKSAGPAACGLKSADSGMVMQWVSMEELVADPKNARVHDERNLGAICASLKQFGQQKPIVVDGDGVILAGNGTFAAARKLGWTQIQAVRTKLTGAAARAFAIADNRTAELADWDLEELAKQTAELEGQGFGIGDLGFEEGEIEKMIEELENGDNGAAGGPDPASFGPVGAETQARLDQRKAVRCPNCEHEFVPGANH